MDPGLSLKLLGKNYSSPGVVKLNDYGLGVAENPAVTMRGASFLRIKLTQEESQAKRYRAQDQLHWRPQIQTNLNSTLSLDLGAIFPFFFFFFASLHFVSALAMRRVLAHRKTFWPTCGL